MCVGGGGGPNYYGTRTSLRRPNITECRGSRVAGSIDETGTNKDARQINGSSGGPSSVCLQLTTCFTVQTVH